MVGNNHIWPLGIQILGASSSDLDAKEIFHLPHHKAKNPAGGRKQAGRLVSVNKEHHGTTFICTFIPCRLSKIIEEAYTVYKIQ